MIKRLIWFVLGAAVGVYVIKKIRDYAKKSTPEAIGQRMTARAGSIGASASDFVDRARAAMAEREAELRAALRPAQESPLGQPQPSDDSER